MGTATSPGLNDHVIPDLPTAPSDQILATKLRLLLSKLVESINYNSDTIKQIGNLNELCDSTRKVVIAMPGVSTIYDEARIKSTLSQFRFASPEEITIIDDTWAVLIAGLRNCRGLSVIAGTGASAYIGLDRFRIGKKFKLDGFGSLLGDWGSGFRLVTRLLEEAGRHNDRDQEDFPLGQELLKKASEIRASALLDSFIGLQNWFDDLVRDTQADWRTSLANLASVVTEAADASTPCELAKDLVVESANQLLDTIEIAFSRLKSPSMSEFLPDDFDPNQFPIVFKGGQMEHSHIYCKALIEGLVQRGIKSPLYFSEFGPVVGSAMLAMTDRISPENADLIRFLDELRQWPTAKNDRFIVEYPYDQKEIMNKTAT